MADFSSSTQLENWTINSLDAFRKRAQTTQENIKKIIDKYTHKAKQEETPIYKSMPYKIQQELLDFCIHNMYYTYGLKRLRLSPKVLGTALTYFRRFYLDRSIFEFDPIPMMFGCIYLATKIEEIQFCEMSSSNVEAFCKAVNEDKYCTVEALTSLEVFLLKALKFELIVYTPFQLLDLMRDTLLTHLPSLDPKLFSDYYTAHLLKSFQIEHIFFTYTPSQIALACTDLALSEMSSKGELAAAADIVGLFPDLDLRVWDREAEVKKHLSSYVAARSENVQAIRKKLAYFHQMHPEFKGQTMSEREKRESKLVLGEFAEEEEAVVAAEKVSESVAATQFEQPQVTVNQSSRKRKLSEIMKAEEGVIAQDNGVIIEPQETKYRRLNEDDRQPQQ
ncbi:hypothetical protein FGO68_gene4723 [Halteria grandinella]|uniref:Cyclin N-terminal domain-containing protein n=1 Tax=Halteria grandinella TaxID=5974 RepID=A0A8J8NZL2_HALGN|nr:hypothetical protein FGO68_gene4723 [Halteria grandinella]